MAFAVALEPGCGSRLAPCGAGNCEGCCDSLGECHAGTGLYECGASGQSCERCEAAQVCREAACQIWVEADGGGFWVRPDGGPVRTDGGKFFLDAGLDAGQDAGRDGGLDAGVDGGRADGGYDGGTDAGVDAGFDAGFDAGYDAGTDAGAADGGDAGDPDAGDGG